MLAGNDVAEANLFYVFLLDDVRVFFVLNENVPHVEQFSDNIFAPPETLFDGIKLY